MSIAIATGFEDDAFVVYNPVEVVTVVENEVSCAIYKHTLNVPCSINDNVERVTCYTYSTRGMFDAVGQKELVLTVKTSENSSGYPASPIEFFAYLYEQAKNGNKFDEGGYVSRNLLGFSGAVFGPPDLDALEDLIGVVWDDNPYIGVVPVKQEELEFAKINGATSLLAILGLEYKQFPFPLYCDPKRQSVVKSEDLQKLKHSSHILMSEMWASWNQSTNRITMFVAAPLTEQLVKALESCSGDNPVKVHLTFDPNSTLALVWNKETDGHSIHKSNQPGKDTVSGSFVKFCTDKEYDQVFVEEDGFVVETTASTWQTFMQYLSTGIGVIIRSDNDNGFEFKLKVLNVSLDVDEIEVPSEENFNV